MKNVIVHGCYHTRNFGDLLMLDMIGRHLGKSPLNRVTSPWIHNEEVKNLAVASGNGLKGCFFKDAAILGGGGYFVDDASDKRSTQRLLRYSVPAAIWRLFNIPYQIVGVGVGPELTSKGAQQVKFICNGAKHINVRDDESKALLVDIGVPDNKISVTADFVIGLEKSDIPEASRMEALSISSQFDKTKRQFGLHISLGADKTELINKIALRVAEGLGDGSGVQIVWLFDHAVSNLDLIEKLNATYFPDALIIDKKSHWTTAALLGELDAVLTTKLHVGITAWALGVPPCSLASHGKTKRFYKQIGRSDFQIDLSENVDKVSEWVNLFSNDYNNFSSESAFDRERLKGLSISNFDIIDNFLSAV